MGLIRVFNNPVIVDLEHNDIVIDTFTDEWGTHDVYRIDAVHWENLTDKTWVAIVAHPTTGEPVVQLIDSYGSGSKNLPTPTRFNSYPLTIHCTLVRG